MTNSADVAALETRLTQWMLRALQLRTSAPFRHQIAELVATAINKNLEFTPPTDAASGAHFGTLQSEGYTRLGQLLAPQQVDDVVRHFLSRPCYNAHVSCSSDKVPRLVGQGAEEFHYGSYPLADVIDAPHLLELANSPLLLNIAARYLGCTPTLYSLNAWWSFSGHGRASSSQEFHRDDDDYKFCTLFVFLTDVGLRSGAHLYIRRSHRLELIEAIVRDVAPKFLQRTGRPLTVQDVYGQGAGYGRDGFYEQVFDGLIDTVTGSAGFGFIADTGGLHKGEPLSEGRRLMFWARYGLYSNCLVGFDGIEPVEGERAAGRLSTDMKTAYINRCIIAP